MERSLLSKLTHDEAREWQTARAQAEADGTFLWDGRITAR
jgi:hypothetical protein